MNQTRQSRLWFSVEVISLVLLILIVVYLVAPAPLAVTRFTLFEELLKLCALIRRQYTHHLLVRASHGLTQFCAKRLHTTLRVCALCPALIALV